MQHCKTKVTILAARYLSHISSENDQNVTHHRQVILGTVKILELLFFFIGDKAMLNGSVEGLRSLSTVTELNGHNYSDDNDCISQWHTSNAHKMVQLVSDLNYNDKNDLWRMENLLTLPEHEQVLKS